LETTLPDNNSTAPTIFKLDVSALLILGRGKGQNSFEIYKHGLAPLFQRVVAFVFLSVYRWPGTWPTKFGGEPSETSRELSPR